MKKEDYVRYYSKLSNVELLKILEEKKDYQPCAIAAAEEILSERDYNADELNKAKAEIDARLNKKLERNKKITESADRIVDFIDENLGIWNRTPARMLNLFCAGIAIYLLIGAFNNFRFLASYLESELNGYIFAAMVYALEFLFVFLLYKRSNWGWVLFVFFAGLFGAWGLESLISSFQPSNSFFLIPVNRGAIIFSLIINIAIILFLNNRKIVQQFSIGKQGRDTTFIILAVVGFLYFLAEYIL